jgi:perosamine synthetase
MTRGILGDVPTLSPAGLTVPRRRKLPFPLQEDSVILSERGRHSLFLGLKALGVGAGDEVLVPAYHHGSEVEAILRCGAECRFYAGTDRLEPDPSELEELVGPRTRALHLTHYIGFGQDCERWQDWCAQRGLLLLEDAAQSWLSQHRGRPLGSFGDLAIFCLYKSVGVWDGAALVCREPVEVEHARAAAGLAAAAKPAVLWAAQHGVVPERVAMRKPGGGEFDAATEFALGDPAAPPSRATSSLIGFFDYPRVPERRRRHYQRLLASLRDRVEPPFDELPDGTSPMIFLLKVKDKAGFIEHMRAARIKPVDFWSVPHPAYDPERFAAIAERRATTVGLPVHQELSDADVDRIAATAASWAA